MMMSKLLDEEKNPEEQQGNFFNDTMISFCSIADLALDVIAEVKNNEVEESVQETEEDKRRKQMKDHCKDMIENTSFHGINYIVDKSYPVRRIIWLVITVSAFIYSLLKVHKSTMKYLEYPFTTSVTRRYSN